jgi:hypothetical protein
MELERGFVTWFTVPVARTRSAAPLWSALRRLFPEGAPYVGDS